MSENYIELFVEYLRSERNASNNTIQSYVFDLTDFCTYAAGDFSEKKIICYLALLKEKQLKVSSIKRKLSALHQFFRFLYQEEILANNPAQFVSQPKYKRPLPKIISEKMMVKLLEATQLLEYQDKVRADLMLYLLYGSGLRVSELITLKRNSMVNSEFIRIFGKGSKERIVPVASIVSTLASEWLAIADESSWLFPSVDSTKHITRQRVFQILKKLAAYAGLDATKISPHVLRHAFATHILDNGGDLLSLKKMLGHKEIATTEIYTHVTRKKLAATVHKFHPLAANKKA
jgi:integrase/recombinase XerD